MHKGMIRHLIFLTFLVAGSALAGPVDRLVLIGDSLTDTGNLSTLTGGAVPPAPYFDGRFSNGDIWVDQIADAFGLALNNVWRLDPTDPTQPLGDGNVDNYAVAGAMTTTYTVTIPASAGGTVTADIANAADLQSFLAVVPDGGPVNDIPGMQQQFGLYQFDGVDPNATHLIWGGANDVAFSYLLDQGRTAAFDFFSSLGTDDAALIAFARATAQNIVDVAMILVGPANMVEDVVVVNLPDLGTTPYAAVVPAPLAGLGVTAPLWSAYLTTASLAFNDYLAQELTGVGVRLFDVAASLQALIDDPTAFGLTNAADPCLTSTSICAQDEQDGYLFWDDLHPTRATHAILAGQLAPVIPVPAPIALLAAGLLFAGLQRHRART